MRDLLTVAEAAKLAGVSVRTMRRRVAAGLVATAGHGQARRIVAASVAAPSIPSESVITATNGRQGDSDPPASTAMTEDSAATRVTAAPEVGTLAELIGRLTERLAEQTGLTAMWQERAGTLSDRLALAESKLTALEAPQPQNGPLDAPTSTERPAPIPEPSPAPFPAPLPPTPNAVPRWRTTRAVDLSILLVLLLVVAAAAARLLGGW